jgi:hypothetical protein
VSVLSKCDRAFGAVLGTGARLGHEIVAYLIVPHHTVPVLVGREHVGRQNVATAMTRAHVDVDRHLHEPALTSSSPE